MIKSLRIQHWIKNIVIFAAPLFALETGISQIYGVVGGFFSFSFLASAFYLVNDVLDREHDRNHPLKNSRPIARGDLSVAGALMLSGILGAGALTAAYFIEPLFFLILLCYASLQVLYNWRLKHKAIFDIMVIAVGFVLRALSGAVIAGVPASGWFLLCVGFLAFFLGIEKRKAELNTVKNRNLDDTRLVLNEYNLDWLHKMENLVTSAAIITYSLWTIESSESNWFLVTIPLVIFPIFKYQQLSETEMAETPEKIMLKNPEIITSVLLWGGASLFILLIENGYLF